jgi:hypothetical protein
MTNSDDMIVRETARRICADEAKKRGFDDWAMFLKGDFDDVPWMQIASKSVIEGIKIARAIYAD